MTELLGIIANNGNDYGKIKLIVEKLENLPKREHDPLQDIINEANEFLKERS